MNKFAELPLVDPLYSAFQYQGPGSAVLVNNPSVRNWYLNQVLIFTCSRKFLSGFTTPMLDIIHSRWNENPYLDKKGFPMQFLNGYVHPLIRNLIDAGYYVYFNGIDDYYVKGKSWYREKHANHDGLICGYNRDDKTYCMYSYDSNWIYQKFWTPQRAFEAGRKSAFKSGTFGAVWGIKPKADKVEFSSDIALEKIAEYLDSTPEKYPETDDGPVFGIVVQNYIARYVGKLHDGSIPYERMDRRVFRLIWEHKKVMCERIRCIENALGLNPDISKRYAPLVAEAEAMRMLYASHRIKRRDSFLPVIQRKLLALKEKEAILLNELLEKAGGVKTV